MNYKKRPLQGDYSLEKYVTLKGEKFQNELKLLGYFGTDFEEAKKREISQKEGGQGSSRIDNQFNRLNRKVDDITTILTLHEAFFLTHAFGCLEICDIEGKTITPIECWNYFKQYNSRFAQEYTVYYYFRTRGWIVKDGNNYGATFLLYKRGPSLDHSRYAVIIGDESQDWQSLLTYHRVIQSVKKDLLLVFLSPFQILKNNSFRPESMKELNITTRIFKAKPNFIQKICNDKNVKLIDEF